MVAIDERFLRVGSSNFNHRSEGFDTECDVAVEAASEEQGVAIAGFRNTLLGEHLDAEPSTIERMLRETGSLVAVVDRLNTGRRGLRTFDGIEVHGESALVWGTDIVDPRMPFRPFRRTGALLRRWAGQVFALLSRLLALSQRRNSAIDSEIKPSGNGRKK